jgi:hypothetical protein
MLDVRMAAGPAAAGAGAAAAGAAGGETAGGGEAASGAAAGGAADGLDLQQQQRQAEQLAWELVAAGVAGVAGFKMTRSGEIAGECHWQLGKTPDELVVEGAAGGARLTICLMACGP